jgi:DNA polymerase I
MDRVPTGSIEHRVLDSRQKAVKVITNAVYGYAGWIGARWYAKPVAEAASAWGRHMILSAVGIAEKAGFNVIYGDTDSIFVSSKIAKTSELKKGIERKIGLDVDVAEFYVRILFTEAKKRYAGLKQDGTIDIVGLEVIRGDWAEVAKKVQKSLLEIVLKDQDPIEAIDYIRVVIDKLQKKKIPLRDLIIWKTLTKPINKYAVRAAHVEAAKMLLNRGWRLSVGNKVGYLILCGEGPLYQRVKPYVFASYDEVDVDYYVSRQIVPAAARVLESFGIKEEELHKAFGKNRREKNLLDFIGDQS